jgi:hypothetical protein
MSRRPRATEDRRRSSENDAPVRRTLSRAKTTGSGPVARPKSFNGSRGNPATPRVGKGNHHQLHPT